MKNAVLLIKRTSLILLCIFITHDLYAQNEVANDVLLKGIDFHLIGTSYHFAKKIRQDFSIGGEIGLLPGIYKVLYAGKHFTEENTLWSSDRSEADQHKLIQLFWVHFFSRWKPEKNWFELDTGLRWALYRNKIPFDDSFGSPDFFGFFVKPMIGYNKFKLGIRFDLGYMFQDRPDKIQEFVIIASPLIRFNFN